MNLFSSYRCFQHSFAILAQYRHVYVVLRYPSELSFMAFLFCALRGNSLYTGDN